ncbi:hypothetical protein [Clostridium sp. KNHs216]|uniref:hypothetical protein n=1 Tax=Clostridium sp. KNHs216 TaxID=1550235 RepID=UPI00114F113C|nr:hypothetical protein [Clostridium sp. KNHs216]TQI67847.1 hypothetical protein LY85_2553 [Clostridium sp. KNHs216]
MAIRESLVVFAVVIGVATLISLVCYVLYYNLGDRAGYFDGMIPLFMAALVTAGISIAMRSKKRQEPVNHISMCPQNSLERK